MGFPEVLLLTVSLSQLLQVIDRMDEEDLGDFRRDYQTREGLR